MIAALRALLHERAIRRRLAVADRLSPPGTLVHDLDLSALAVADLEDALADIGVRRAP